VGGAAGGVFEGPVAAGLLLISRCRVDCCLLTWCARLNSAARWHGAALQHSCSSSSLAPDNYSVCC
jgi:hypothetical protein